jgi:hypothetical protein
MSENKIWISMGFIEGRTLHEACQSVGHTPTDAGKKVGGYTEVATDKGVLQLLQVTDRPGCKWLAFRLVDPTAPRIDYVPSGKRPRKKREDAGKPRKEKAPEFTVVGTLDFDDGAE